MPPLRTLRRRAGYSQRQLAAASGVSKQTIFAIERQGRRPRPETASRLARALGVYPDEIDEFGDNGERQ